MSIQISQVFQGLAQQQFPALLGILRKAQEYAAEQGVSEAELLQTRLIEDMHPLIWQIQTTVELCSRGAARLLGNEVKNVELSDGSIAEVIKQIKQLHESLLTLDTAGLDASSDKTFEIPIGPDAQLTLSGRDYVLKFLLPNVYFHLTTTYALLRQRGVDLGKRDFLGAV